MLNISNITLLSLHAQHPTLPDSARLSVQCLVDGKVIAKSEAMEGRKSIWRYRDTLQLNCAHEQAVQLAIVQPNADDEKELAAIDLNYAEIVGDISKKKKKYFDWTVMEKTMLVRLKIELESGSPIPVLNLETVDHVPEDIITLLDELKSESSESSPLNKNFIHLIRKRILAIEEIEDKTRHLQTLCTILAEHWYAHGHTPDVILATTCYLDLFRLCNNIEVAEKLGVLGYECFQACGDVSAIKQSIRARQRVVEILASQQTDESNGYVNLGTSALAAYNMMNEVKDGDIAIAAYTRAAEIIPDPDKRKYNVLLNLANSYSSKFDSLNRLVDLNEAISASQKFIQLREDDHSFKAHDLNYLGDLLLVRFKYTGDMEDIEEAFRLFELAAKTQDDYYLPQVLNNLGRAYLARYDYSGIQDDIEQAIGALEKALDSSSEYHPVRPYILINLARAYQFQYETTNDLTILDKSIKINEDVLKTIPYGHPTQPLTMNNLSNLYRRKFEISGNFLDIDKTVALLKDAIEVTLDFDPGKLGYLNNLAGALSRRFERFGIEEDYTAALETVERVVELVPEKHADRAMFLNNFANILFAGKGFRHTTDKAIAALDEAVDLTSDVNKSKPVYLYNLGNALVVRYEKAGAVKDIQRAVAVHQNAVDLLQQDDRRKATYLLSLGDSLVHLFKVSCNREDIDKGIVLMEEGIAHVGDDDFEGGIFYATIGMAFLERLKEFGDKGDLESGIAHFRKGYQSISSPKVKLNAVLKWENSARVFNHPSLMDAYVAVFELLPELAWLGLAIQDQYSGLTALSGVVRRAVTVAIQEKRYTTALEWSEQGHSVVWNQFLKLKSPDVEALQAEHPELAKEFQDVASRLQMMSIHMDSFKMINSFREYTSEETAQQQRSATLEWENVVRKIRMVSGFEDFLMPRKEFSGAARLGYAIVVNTSSMGCDALVLKSGQTSTEIIHIPLDSFSESEAQALLSTFNEIISKGKRSARSARPVPRNEISDSRRSFQRTLAALWVKIAIPILDGLEMKSSTRTANLPRIWWCLAGPLAFLPIHAAGLYELEQFGTKLSDYAISSYTPTLSALLQKIERENTAADRFKLLVVGQHTTKGQSDLPGVIEEMKVIQKHANASRSVVLEQSEITIENVSREMQQATWAHFACHGIQDISNPTESGLILPSGDRLTLQEMMKLNLPNAELAFLSACQTATGAKELPEEAIHLAAGMLFAGYKGVVATMWAIGDDEAPKVADLVYGGLFGQQKLNFKEAARALHCAVQDLRKIHGADYLDWVPFIHIGL